MPCAQTTEFNLLFFIAHIAFCARWRQFGGRPRGYAAGRGGGGFAVGGGGRGYRGGEGQV